MKHVKIYEGLSYKEFVDILSNTPTYYPVFKLTIDYNFTDSYLQKHTLEKGLEIYTDTPLTGAFLKTLDKKNITAEIDESVLEFVEYRDAKKIEEHLNMYKDAKKYNL